MRRIPLVRKHQTSATTRVLFAVVAALSVAVQAQPHGANSAAQAEGSPGAGAKATIDCLLPSEIRRYGQEQHRLAPRRLVRSTHEECTRRNGEVVVVERQ